YAALGADAVFERGATVAAMLVQEADAAAEIAEEDERLAEQLHHQRQLAELGTHRHRMPEAAHVLAARRARSDMGELDILAGLEDAMIAAIGKAVRLGRR